MAQVFLAIQKNLGRPVALKVLRGDFSHSPELSERFLNEARTVAALNHANIITIHDVGIALGCHDLSMEYVEGGDLRSRITAGMPPLEALELLKAIGSALHHAHQAGVVHRDVKPANILFRTDGTPLLTDFGIAKNLDTAEDLTLTGALIGSPNYLSPEQAQGTKVDGRTDIYSLGIIFYNMLVGEKPYEADSPMATIYKQIHEPIPKLPEPLRMYQPLLDRMTAKRPEDRFEDAGRLLNTIDSTMRSVFESTAIMAAPVQAQATPAPRAGSGGKKRSADRKKPAPRAKKRAARGRARAPRQRRRLGRSGWAALSLGAGVIVVVAALVAGTGLFEGEPEPRPAQPAPATVKRTTPTPTPSKAAPPRAQAPENTADRVTAGPAPRRTSPAVSRSAKVARLVARGEKALAENRLTVPRTDSAHYYFRKALELDPSHSGARSGIARVANAYLKLARADLRAGRTSQAIKRVNLGLSVQPRSKALLAFKAHIERQIEIARLLDRAKIALANYRLTTPARDNALHYYREVLKLDPGNRAASRGLGAIAQRYAKLAEGLVADYEYEKAQQYIARGLEVQPRNRRLLELREQARISNAPKQFIGDIKRFFGSE